MTEKEFDDRIMAVVRAARAAEMSIDDVCAGLRDAYETMNDVRKNALADVS